MTLEEYESRIREKEYRKKNYPFMRFFSARFAAGIIILMNPVVSLIDVFPDFIGYWLIYSALDELKRINDDMQTAALRMKYLIALGAVRFLVSFETFKLDSSWIMTLVTAFGVAELFFIILFFNSFFSGITYFQERHEGEGDFVSSSEIKFLSIFFFCIKTATTMIPQLWAILEVKLMDELYEERIELYAVIKTKPFAILVSVIVCLIFGVVWMVKFIKYLRNIRKCDTLFGNLKEKFNDEILNNNTFYVNKKVCFALSLVSIGHLFLFDITFERVHVMPEALFVAVVFAGVVTLGRLCSLTRVLVSSALAFASGILVYYFRYHYIDESITRVSQLPTSQYFKWGAVYFVFALAAVGFAISVQRFVSELGSKYFDEDIRRLFFIPNLYLVMGLIVAGICYGCPPLRYYLITLRIVIFAVWAYKNIKIYKNFSSLIKED